MTSVDNGLALCHHCHHLVHDRGWTASLDIATSAATWTRPDGVVVVTSPRAGPAPPEPRARPTLPLDLSATDSNPAARERGS